ncbi:PREDICTED: uncharacterized protein LOC104743984 [Camelina sativa]|uniref:Uncharacterized protein LOC104743984 n=1 Tax=Camelina sativa TaxID=90675 RepID=A0ABM0VYY4_CAMSA|nr:PREDICTED: uncharacterized protein LOC104743984 [Camelina sativa]
MADQKGMEKVTWMKLKTEPLSSEKNVAQVRKTLCSIPQVRDQKFDEGSNTVTIKVVCCSPEKVMDKLCSKGRGSIKLIETIDPPKPPAEKPKEPAKPKEAEKPKEPEKPKPALPAPASSSKAVMVAQPYYSPVMGQPAPWYNEPNYGWSRPNGYDERVVHDSYTGQPPPPPYGYRSEYSSDCSIM